MELDGDSFWKLGGAAPPLRAVISDVGAGSRKRARSDEEATVVAKVRPGERLELGGGTAAVPWRHARATAATLASLHSGGADVLTGGGGLTSPPSRAALLRLHEEVLDFAAFVSPTPSEVAIAGRALTATHTVLIRLFPAARIEVFGSRAQGLVLPTSDWDLVLLGVPPNAAVMNRIASELRLAGVARSTEVIHSARVPIVKLVDKASGIAIDISFEAVSGLASRAVIADLLARYPPLRPLIIVFKYFLVQRGLNDTYTGGVGSFLLVCMCTAAVQSALRNALEMDRRSGATPPPLRHGVTVAVPLRARLARGPAELESGRAPRADARNFRI